MSNLPSLPRRRLSREVPARATARRRLDFGPPDPDAGPPAQPETPLAPRPAVSRHRSRALLLPRVRAGARDPLVRARLYRRAAARLALRRLAVPPPRSLGR